MKPIQQQVAVGSVIGSDEVWSGKEPMRSDSVSIESEQKKKPRELHHVAATFITSLACFGVFFVQGMIIARILGPLGRGEFGSAIYFPRDILLYAGLLGGVEIVNAYAKKGSLNSVLLKQSAAMLGVFSGLVTAVAAGVLATVVFTLIPEKSYLIPLCLLCCVFLPFEHLHLTISAVDRGEESYSRYNFNRLVFALSFPALVLIVFGFDELFKSWNSAYVYRGFDGYLGLSTLVLMCVVFILSKVVGLLPTLRGMQLKEKLFRRLNEKPGAQESARDVPRVRRLLTEGRPYAMSMFATELFERLDIFLILALGTIQDAGYYFVAVPAAALLTIAPNALGIFTFNAGADRNRVVSLREGVSVMLGITVTQLLATGLFMVIIPFLIVFFYSEAYADAIPFAMWLLPASAIKGYLQAVDGYLKGRGKPLIGVWSRVLSIFVMLVFVWFTYESFGLISIPMAACVGQAISMAIITIAVIRDILEQQKLRPSLTTGGTE